MRNISFSVPSSLTLNWENDWDPRGAQYREILALLEELLETSKDVRFRSPSEERVLEDFSEWTIQASGKGLFDPVCNSSFVYCNLNSGKTVVVVACTSEEYHGMMRHKTLFSAW